MRLQNKVSCIANFEIRSLCYNFCLFLLLVQLKNDLSYQVTSYKLLGHQEYGNVAAPWVKCPVYVSRAMHYF